jgi:hypothetical protein
MEESHKRFLEMKCNGDNVRCEYAARKEENNTYMNDTGNARQ